MEFTCLQCDKPLTGRRRYKARFCGSACRQRAYRRRAVGLPETLPVREPMAGFVREPFAHDLIRRSRSR